MPNYEKVPDKVNRLIARVMKKHQPYLHAAKVTVSAVFAHAKLDANDQPTGPAIKHHSRAALGVIQITPLKLRAVDVGDVMLTLDGDRWNELTSPQQAALIDHELEHIRVRWEAYPDKESGSDGIPKRDDLDRPKLYTALHDYEIGGFSVMFERHGAAAIEHLQAASLKRSDGQYLLPFFRDPPDLPALPDDEEEDE